MPAALFVLLALALFSFTADDSYIAFRYARNVAAGLGPVFDLQAPREAFSSPLWVLLSAVPYALHLSDTAAVIVMKAVGVAMGAITVFVTGVLARQQARNPRAGVLGALFVAVMPWMAFWSAGGLETSLYTALLVGALVRLDEERSRGASGAGSTALFVLLTFTRPEGILVALSVLLAARRGSRGFIPVGSVAGLWLGAEAGRYAYYGALLPTTFQAKAGLSLHALRMRAWELLPFGAYVLPLAIAAWQGHRQARLDRALLAAAAAQAAFAAVPGMEGTPWFRYEVPLLPLLAAGAAAGLAPLTIARPVRSRIAVAGLMLALTLPALWLRHPSRYSPSRVEIALGTWLRSYAPEARLAVYDLGAVPYFSRAPWVFDSNPAGPLSPTLGRPYDLDALIRWSPEWVILPAGDAPPADPLAALASRPDFAATYARLFDLDAGDGYFFAVWKRNDVILSPAARRAADAAHLYQRRESRSTGGRPKYS